MNKVTNLNCFISQIYSRGLLKPFPLYRTNVNRTFFSNTNTKTSLDGVQTYTLHKNIHAPLSVTYDVISEVTKYHNFIPYCTESWVSKRDASNEEKPVEGGLRVGFKQYDEKFLCRIECTKSKDNDLQRTVVAESLTHSLFDKLYSKWTITEKDKKCDVELRLEFKFKSKLYNSVSSIFAKSVTELVMKAFHRRIAHVQKEQYLQEKNK